MAPIIINQFLSFFCLFRIADTAAAQDEAGQKQELRRQ